MAASIVTTQEPDPVHAPLQPVKVEPVAAVAFRVTFVAAVKLALLVVQATPQLTVGEAGSVEAMVPLPVPVLLTESRKVATTPVELVKVPLTPPMVRVVVTLAPAVAELVWRTQTVWPLVMVAGAVVKVPVQLIE